jgi:hypothetical protein
LIFLFLKSFFAKRETIRNSGVIETWRFGSNYLKVFIQLYQCMIHKSILSGVLNPLEGQINCKNLSQSTTSYWIMTRQMRLSRRRTKYILMCGSCLIFFWLMKVLELQFYNYPCCFWRHLVWYAINARDRQIKW